MIRSGNKPVYLNLIQIRLPIAGFMSILHRVSGLFLFLAIVPLIYMLDLSLSSPAGFVEAAELLGGCLFSIALFVVLWSVIHHLLAGLRYLLLDIDIGIDRPHYRYTAWAVVIAAPVMAAGLMGVLL